MTYATALKNTRQNILWGGEIEITAIQQEFERPIVVIRSDANPLIYDNGYQSDPIFILYNGANHYDAFNLTGELTGREILQNIQQAMSAGQSVTYNNSIQQQTTANQSTQTAASNHRVLRKRKQVRDQDGKRVTRAVTASDIKRPKLDAANIMVKSGDQEIKFGDTRPRTKIGPQGDHITAYALFQHLAMKRCKGLSKEESIRMIAHLIDVHFPEDSDDKRHDVQAIIDKIKGHFSEGFSDPDFIEAVRGYLPPELAEKSEKSFLIANDSILEKALSDIAVFYLMGMNSRYLVSVPQEGNIAPPDGEAARVKNAITALSQM